MNKGPEILIKGDGWRVIKQYDGTINLNIERPLDITVTSSVLSVSMPPDFLYRMGQYRRNTI